MSFTEQTDCTAMVMGRDEDQGQLGAWYVMSSIGLFDVKGLTG